MQFVVGEGGLDSDFGQTNPCFSGTRRGFELEVTPISGLCTSYRSGEDTRAAWAVISYHK